MIVNYYHQHYKAKVFYSGIRQQFKRGINKKNFDHEILTHLNASCVDSVIW